MFPVLEPCLLILNRKKGNSLIYCRFGPLLCGMSMIFIYMSGFTKFGIEYAGNEAFLLDHAHRVGVDG